MTHVQLIHAHAISYPIWTIQQQYDLELLDQFPTIVLMRRAISGYEFPGAYLLRKLVSGFYFCARNYKPHVGIS